MSGNGGHLNYRIDLPPDDANLVKRFLEALGVKYDDDFVDVDTTVATPARIMKLYGTVARKGDDTKRRPHRRAVVEEAPDTLEVVPRELLVDYIDLVMPQASTPAHSHSPAAAPAHSPAAAPVRSASKRGVVIEDIDGFFEAAGVVVKTTKQLNKGVLYVLDSCPFENAHGDADFGFIRFEDSGYTIPQCHHNSCQGLGIDDIRQEFLDALPVATATATATASTKAVASLTERFVEHTAKDYSQPVPVRQWIVKDVVKKGGLTMLVGEPGVGKSYAMLDLAACVALGTEWLGHETTQGKVCIVDEENGSDVLHERTHAVMLGHNADDTMPLSYFSNTALNLRDERETQTLYDFVEHFQPSLLILDSLADITAGADENSVADMHRPIYVLHKLAQDTGVGIILLHHTNKAGGYRGSSALKGAVDIMIMLRQPEKLLQFTYAKARYGHSKPFAAQKHWRDGELYLSSAETATVMFNKNQRRVLLYLLENGVATVAEVRSGALEGLSATSAKNTLYNLRDKGYLCRTNEGAPSREPAVYSLTKDGEAVTNTLKK
jgi:hypothetical protein